MASSQTFCRHPYKYDGSDDSDSDVEKVTKIEIESSVERGCEREDESKYKNSENSGESNNMDHQGEEGGVVDAKRNGERSRTGKTTGHEEETLSTESRSKSNSRSRSKSKSKSRSGKSESSEKSSKPRKSRKHRDEDIERSEKPEAKKRDFTETDVESDGEDNSCVKMSIHFVTSLQRTIEKEDVYALRDTLRKTPIAVVLHYLHYLFHLVRDMPDFYRVIEEYNHKYNIVSRYFLKALCSEDRTRDVMASLQKVTSDISSRVPLKEIEGLLHFTPEYIVMATIQSGNLVSHDKIISEWELSSKFMRVRDLIAAFFGIKRYFSDPDRYSDRRDLVISCICGGSTKTLARVMRKTKSEYLTEYTMNKTRAICIPNKEMVTYLQERHGLTFY